MLTSLSKIQASGVRYQSTRTLFGIPLIAVALGADPAKGEKRGHAKGVIAIGDLATGCIAVGAIARGFLAIGGLALGFIAAGGQEW